jgi:coniferyl-aldehyde dehydrogenase
MDQSLKSPALSALDDAFHAQLRASRAEPLPACDVRIDRLRRLR